MTGQFRLLVLMSKEKGKVLKRIILYLLYALFYLLFCSCSNGLNALMGFSGCIYWGNQPPNMHLFC